MRKNQGMEVSVIGIPLRGAIRAIRDAAWKQIRRGKGEVWGRGGESQRERECELLSLFFISRPRPLCSLGQYRFIRRPFLFEPPFATLSFFLSFRSLFMRATIGGFDSIPFPAILEIRFFSFGHRFTAHFQPAYLCVQSLLFTVILPFLG